MIRFNPPNGIPRFLGIFAKAIPILGLFACLLNASKNAWSLSSILNLLCVVLISTLVSVVLIMEIKRQLMCEVSEVGFFTASFGLKSSYPFFSIAQVNHNWADVYDIGRSGYTMLLNTSNGTRKINLFLFQDPEKVELFAIEQWRSKKQSAV